MVNLLKLGIAGNTGRFKSSFAYTVCIAYKKKFAFFLTN